MKINKKKIALGLLAVVVIATAAIGANGLKNNSSVSAETVSEQTINVKKGKTKTNETRVDFITSFGWQIVEEPVEILEVLIPEQLDAAYEQYNAIQKDQGFDLSKYCGKQVKRYTYSVTNYPDTPDNVQISLLIYKNTIIAADVCCTKLDGFMHGIKLPQTTGTPVS
ncbi:MAG: DUF4830 domain-containing protein [Oscillospiraceae bacterium]